jgi:serine/threonine protein phosphatase PrpC
MAIEPVVETLKFASADMIQAHIYTIGPLQVGIYSHRAPDKETPNEDAAILIPVGEDSCVLGLADGAGGMRGGVQASLAAIEALQKAIEDGMRNGGGELRDVILNGMENAHADVNALGIGACTTLSVIEVHKQSIRPYHVGDSGILVTGQRGRLKLQSLPHSPVAYAVEAGFLDEAEAMHHEERHLVTNMIGAPGMRIEIGAVLELAARDRLVVASDGLFDNLLPNEIVEHIRRGPLKRGLTELARQCHHYMVHPEEDHPSKPDDLTILTAHLLQ